MRNRCEHGYVIDPNDPCPECERDALREENDRLRAALREVEAACDEAMKLEDGETEDTLTGYGRGAYFAAKHIKTRAALGEKP